MKLRELTPTTGRPGAEIDDAAAESIRVARLPRTDEAAAVDVEPYPVPAGDPERLAAAEPPSLRFATEPPRGVRLGVLPAVSAVAAMSLVLILVVVLASSSNAGTHRSHAPAPKLTPAQQRVEAARRARAAAIAKARRDRGTDAELQDTIPAVTPAPSP